MRPTCYWQRSTHIRLPSRGSFQRKSGSLANETPAWVYFDTTIYFLRAGEHLDESGEVG
jgi:hypothetical protein